MDRHRAASTGTNHMKQIFLITIIVLTGACASSNETTSIQAETSYADAHAAAVAAIEYSAERGHAWSTSDALLEQAVAANAEGNEALAIELANSARMQAEIAAEQANIEERTWSDRVLSD
jgi:hypothetical protein